MRIPYVTRLDNRSIDTIDAHVKVLERLGHVSIAKFGAPNPSVQKLQLQLKENTPTNLILVYKKKADGFHGFRARILAVQLGPPTEQIKNAAPKYYETLGYAAGLWFTIQFPLEKCDLNELRLASNKKPIPTVLAASRLPAMIVETTA